jgi:2-methylcitrate dehydratase PrpD
VPSNPYATCRGSHSGIDAIDFILSTQKLIPSDIAAIHIAISAFQYGMCGSTRITTRAEAQMSLPYALAARLHYGKVFLAELTRWRMARPAYCPLVGMYDGADSTHK